MRITKPTTQRKRMFQAHAHLRHRYFSAPLSPNLKQRHGTNALTVRTGDTVRVTRGDRKGFEGKVTSVDRKKFRVFVEGVTREKVDGTALPIPIHPSKILITNLNLDDKWRREALKRKIPIQVSMEKEEKEEAKDKKATTKKAPKRKRKKKEKTTVEEPKRKKRTPSPKKESRPKRRKRTPTPKTKKGAE